MSHAVSIIFSMALSALFFLLSPASVAAMEWGVVTEAEWTQQAPADYPEADAIVLRDSSYVYMADLAHDSPDGWQFKIEHRRHIRKKVLTPSGIDLVGNASFRYWEGYDLVELKAHTISPDGSTIPVPEDQFFTKRMDNSRECSFAFLQVDSGCVVEYTYTRTFNGYTSSWSWGFGRDLYTFESIFCLQVSGGFQYSYATSHVPPQWQKPLVRTEPVLHQGETKVYKWRMEDIMPLQSEPYMSSIADYTPSLIVQMTRYRGAWYSMDAARDWKELGEQFGGRLNEYCSKPRGFRKAVRDLAHRYDTDYDRSKAIYDHIVHEYQQDGDYYTLAFSHDNMSDMYKEKHGTGAEKNVLLWRMLKQAGIRAWPVLISTRDHGQLPPGVFRIDQFNHLVVFCEVEQGGIYLDATSAYCPYGMLPSQCRTEAGLMVDGGKSSLVRIVTSEPLSLRADFTNMHFEPNGAAVCSLTSVCTGYLAIDFGSEYERNDPEEFIRNIYLDEPGFEYSLEGYSCTLDTLGRLLVTSVLRFPRAASLLGDHLSTAVYQPMLGGNPFQRERRSYPIDFNYPQTYQNIVRLYVPDVYDVAELPEPIQLSIDGLTYSRIPQPIEGGAAWDCKIEINRPKFEVEEYPIIREFFEKMAERGSEEILFTSES